MDSGGVMNSLITRRNWISTLVHKSKKYSTLKPLGTIENLAWQYVLIIYCTIDNIHIINLLMATHLRMLWLECATRSTLRLSSKAGSLPWGRASLIEGKNQTCHGPCRKSLCGSPSLANDMVETENDQLKKNHRIRNLMHAIAVGICLYSQHNPQHHHRWKCTRQN
jgi:hypothetical protein